MSRWKKQTFSKDLEVHKKVGIKQINIAIKDLGYQLCKDGLGELQFQRLLFRIRPGSKVTHKLANPKILVYAIGDYTIEEWRGILFKKLYETSPKYLHAASERERKKKRRREKKTTEKKRKKK